MCYERGFRRVMQDGPQQDHVVVKEIFRAMMPIFNNKNKTVITPLLATGDQVLHFIVFTPHFLM